MLSLSKFCWYCMTLFYLYWHNSKCTKKTLKKHRGLKEGYCPTLFGYATDKEYRIFIVYSIPYILEVGLTYLKPMDSFGTW